MNLAHVPVQIRTGATLRIDTRRYLVGPPGDQVRVFTDKESGTEKPLTNHAILHMMRSGRITTDAAFRALDPNVLANLQIDWGAFSDIEQASARGKYPFVKAIDELPMPFRDKSKHVEPLIERIMMDAGDGLGLKKKPTFRQVRGWYICWLVTGRDIRALVDNHRKKGNRTARLKEWQKEEIAEAINETYRSDLVGSKADAQTRASERILIRANRDGLALPNLGANKVIGKHLVSRMIGKMELYDLTLARHGKQQADLLMKAVRTGPTCSYPLEEVEVDHTRLDLIVVDEHGRVLGRPWLTAIIDRWSRMILGFSLSFTPPSWVSVMEALRIAVQPKEPFLDGVCRAIARENTFKFPWPCYGSPSRLFCDNGPEFRAASMKETEQALDMQIVDLPRASGWLKGRIERWLRSLNQGVIHKLPGTTKSNPRDRGKYKSEKHAVLTLEDAIWIITKWIVDIYHSREHSRTGEKPLDRWIRGVAEVGERPAPPNDIIVPLTGLVIDRKLGPSGITFEGLRWNSNGFSALRNRLGIGDTLVKIRIDPFDLKTAYVLDTTRLDDRDAWIEGDLHADEGVRSLTLYQYRIKRQAEQNETVESFDSKEALTRALASQEILDLVNERQPMKKKLPKKAARFLTDGRNASEHVRGERFSSDESENELGSHDHHNSNILSPPPDQRGPWRDRTAAVEAPLPRMTTPVRRFDTDTANEEIDDPRSGPQVAKPNSTFSPIVVKRRRLD
ncbi:hypothetical protein [Afipia carboxidovorans]|jgi:putative transposase|uniref:hypothetical protein n=1 Tax=Afipia carboxidovorans TaxID=40137 RepID=UPI0030CDFFFE